MPLTADITSDIPVPSRTAASTVHRTMREFVAYVQQYRTLPDIPVASINIQDDDHPSGLVITEDMRTTWAGVFRCAYDQSPHISRRVTLDGKVYYRGNIKKAGLHTCELCGITSNKPINVDSRGFCDRCRVSKASPKQAPHMGWIVSRANATDVSPTFGFELELEAIRNSKSYDSPQTYAEDVIRKVEGHPPIVSTTDSSLTNGCEMVSHPLSYDWINENNHTLATMFKELRKDFRAEDYGGEHKASFHVHVSKEIFNDAPEITTLLNVDWVNYHFDFLVALSGRPSSSFKKWCTGGYKYIAPRNQQNTWECRGFSNHAIFDHDKDPDFDACEDMIHICNWIRAIAWMTHDVKRFGLSPADLIVQAGFPESLLWVRDFDGADRASTELATTMERKAWELQCKAYGSHISRCIVRLRPGGSLGGPGLRTTQGAFNAQGLAVALENSSLTNGVELTQTFNGTNSIRAWVMPQHLEIVEGVPFPGEIPSIAFVPSIPSTNSEAS